MNARIPDPTAMPVAPGLVGGGYFIPLANLNIVSIQLVMKITWAQTTRVQQETSASGAPI